MTHSSTIVISLGGSVLVPSQTTPEQQTVIMKQYSSWLQQLSTDRLVIVIVGGGKTARQRIAAAKQAQPTITAEDLDWIGIQATHENAATLQQHCGAAVVHSAVITDPRVTLSYTKGLVIGGGWQPGRSTDYDAVMLASYNQVEIVYNMSNVTTVYDKDPRRYADAQPLPRSITWQQLLAVTGTTWSPGLNTPFDPIAAQLALEKKITVRLVNTIEQINQAVHTGQFTGTTIHP